MQDARSGGLGQSRTCDKLLEQADVRGDVAESVHQQCVAVCHCFCCGFGAYQRAGAGSVLDDDLRRGTTCAKCQQGRMSLVLPEVRGWNESKPRRLTMRPAPALMCDEQAREFVWIRQQLRARAFPRNEPAVKHHRAIGDFQSELR